MFLVFYVDVALILSSALVIDTNILHDLRLLSHDCRWFSMVTQCEAQVFLVSTSTALAHTPSYSWRSGTTKMLNRAGAY